MRGAHGLLENNPFINRLIINDHQGCLALSTLSFEFSFSIDKSLVAAGLLEVPKSIIERRGFGVDAKTASIIPLNVEAQRLYEIGLSDHEKFYVNKKSEGQLIVESLGLSFQQDEYVFEFTEAEEQQTAIDRERLQPGAQVIGLNTGCSGVIPYKKLTVRNWIELIDVLSKDFPAAQILLLGGPEDTDRNNEIFSQRPHVTRTPTRQGLRAGLRYVNMCDVVVTGDSLGMHMAIALKKWVVAWFGPTCAHEIELYGRGVSVLSTASCSPCWKRVCDQAKMCYDQVSWLQISQGVAVQLKSSTREKSFAASARKLSEIVA